MARNSVIQQLREWKLKEMVGDPDARRGESPEVRTPTPATGVLWRVEAETSIKDPRDADDAAWDGCRVLAFTARFMGVRTVLIDASDADAARLRSVRGVRSVDRSSDRHYFDDRTESQVSVLNGCLSIPE
jgi:hypothetical protein